MDFIELLKQNEINFKVLTNFGDDCLLHTKDNINSVISDFLEEHGVAGEGRSLFGYEIYNLKDGRKLIVHMGEEKKICIGRMSRAF